MTPQRDVPPTPEMSLLLKIEERMARLEARVKAICPPEKPLRVSEFAKRVGLSRFAVYERIRRGDIVKRSGLIPAEELAKFGL